MDFTACLLIFIFANPCVELGVLYACPNPLALNSLQECNNSKLWLRH